jgi:hypothetical protein
MSFLNNVPLASAVSKEGVSLADSFGFVFIIAQL